MQQCKPNVASLSMQNINSHFAFLRFSFFFHTFPFFSILFTYFLFFSLFSLFRLMNKLSIINCSLLVIPCSLLKLFYEPNMIAAMMLPLRRTLVLSASILSK